jgi:hypothetical protein
MRLVFWLCTPLLRLTRVAHRARRQGSPLRGYARTPGPRRARALAGAGPSPLGADERGLSLASRVRPRPFSSSF